MKKRLTVIGGGAWGTALAIQAVRAGADVELILRNPDLAEQINANGENDLYLPGVSLPGALRATTAYDGLRDADAVLLVTPAQHLRETLTKLAAHWTDDLPAVICCKGIEKETGALMAQVVTETLGNVPVAVLSGPTFAKEVATGLPAAITLACEDRGLGKRLVELIGTPEFRPYFSTDVAGVEVAGAIKNVLAIASGVVAGLGDLTLTCTGTLSRNYTFGVALGQGRKSADILGERRSVTEGVYTAASITAVAVKYQVEMPICTAVDQVANHGSDLRSTINGLLQRPFRDELETAR